MSNSVYATRVLQFSRFEHLINFLLTCQSDADLGPGSGVWERYLSQIYVVSSRRQQAFLVQVAAHRDLLKRVLAIADTERAKPARAIPQGAGRPQPVSRLMRRILLRSARPAATTPPHLLAVFWRTNSEELSTHVHDLWNLGAGQMEIAFVRSGKNRPRHLVRIHGFKHPDAFYGWWQQNSEDVEVYTPSEADEEETVYYVLGGYCFPVPGLARLSDLHHERALVLIRPNPSRGQAPEWIALEGREAEFFWKSYEVVDLEVTRDEQPLVELEADRSEQAVPMELAIVAKPRSALTTLLQIDKEIERERRALRELENKRARLVGGEREELYFAYRFDQASPDELNPLLIRLMQQRLGTLAHFEYAYCQPTAGDPYHLVIATQTQQQHGFSLQLADGVYYQPANWQTWGVNLFLPMDMELAPRVDTNDAIPMLQRFLEQSTDAGDETLEAEPENGDFRDWAAILWERGYDGEIVETRVRETVPLLSQFRLLNSFQARSARSVGEATRRSLLETMQANWNAATVELDALERDLLAFVRQRSTAIEESYAQMDQRLATARRLVEQLEPQVDKVTEWVRSLPNAWVEFVGAVISKHYEISREAVGAHEELRREVLADRAGLRALVLRNRDLTAMASRERERLDSHFQTFDKSRAGFEELRQSAQSLAERVVHVLEQVQSAHGQLAARIEECEAREREVEALQQEIDEIDERERDIGARLEEMRRRHALAKQREAGLKKKGKEIESRQRLLAEKSAEMFQLREDLRRQEEQISARLRHMEEQMEIIRAQSAGMESLHDTLHEQVELIDAHAGAVETWDSYRHAWETDLTQRGTRLHSAVQRMNDLAATTRQQHEELDTLRGELRSVEVRLLELLDQLKGDQTDGDE